MWLRVIKMLLKIQLKLPITEVTRMSAESRYVKSQAFGVVLSAAIWPGRV